jgi:hypothetical protein
MRIPIGYRAVTLGGALGGGPLSAAVLVREQPDALGGRFVRLRETFDAMGWLGAFVDASGEAHEWIEIWSQRGGFGGADPAWARGVTNSVMDERWVRNARMLAEAEPASVIASGFEGRGAPVISIDVERFVCAEPSGPGPSAWRLCTDDGLLIKAGLPAYGTGVERFWIGTTEGGEHCFAHACAGQTEREGVLSHAEAVGAGRALLHAGGRLMIRRYRPASYAETVDAMTTGSWSADDAGGAGSRVPVSFDGRPVGHSSAERGSRKGRMGDEALILARRGPWGALIETLHLKLRLFGEAVACVSRAVERSERPLLNVSDDVFRVSMSEQGPGLPRWWTSRVSLAEPGEAIELTVGAGETRYYVAARPTAGGVYRPAAVAGGASVRGTVRLRQVVIDADKSVSAEATLALPSVAMVGRNDLVWIRLAIGGRRLDLHGTAERSSAMAVGEWRFRSSKLVMDAAASSAVKGLEGVPIPDVEIEVVPLLSSPCDLHGLGVLGARTLLVNGESSLAVVADELQSLAREAGAIADGSTSLATRIQRLANNDRRWAESLGPQRLTDAGLTADSALAMIPAELWWDVVGTLVRMFPGAGADAVCRDLGDAPATSPHMVFHTTLEDISRLLVRTRSLVVIDWGQNREVNAVIRGYLLKHGAAEGV